jgi:glycosyltransferase involved in cell wall biosynthesis
MRILTISDLYPPDMRGGAEVVTRDVVDGLRDRGHEVVVATAARGPARADVRPAWSTVPSAVAGRSRWCPWRAATEYRRAFCNPRNEAAVAGLLAEVDPQVVYVGGVNGVSPCSILRVLRDHLVPVVVHLHEYWLPDMLQGGSESARLRLPWLKRRLVGLNAGRDLRFTSMVAVSRTCATATWPGSAAT